MNMVNSSNEPARISMLLPYLNPVLTSASAKPIGLGYSWWSFRWSLALPDQSDLGSPPPFNFGEPQGTFGLPGAHLGLENIQFPGSLDP